MKKIILFFCALILVTSCYDTELVFEDQFVPVIQAYLYMNGTIDDIQITKMISFGDDTTGATGISDALVSLIHGDQTWTLLHDTTDTGNYYYPYEIDLSPGDTFILEAQIDELLLRSVTVVPEFPPAMSFSDTVLSIPEVEDMMEFNEIDMPDPIRITWDDADSSYYFFTIDNVDDSPSAIRPDMADRPHRPEEDRIISEPVNTGYYLIDPMSVEYYGTHMIVVFSVNEEYAELYNSQSQDSRELNEPFTNIENGLGIFTAFASDTFYIAVEEAKK